MYFTGDGGPCTPDTCHNGGNCEEKDGKALCHCKPGYNGEFCEDSKKTYQSDKYLLKHLIKIIILFQ